MAENIGKIYIIGYWECKLKPQCDITKSFLEWLKFEKTQNVKCWCASEATGTLIHCSRER